MTEEKIDPEFVHFLKDWGILIPGRAAIKVKEVPKEPNWLDRVKDEIEGRLFDLQQERDRIDIAMDTLDSLLVWAKNSRKKQK